MISRYLHQASALLRVLPSLLRQRASRAPMADKPCLRFVYSDIGAPTRYRVRYQIEQALLAGCAVEDAPLDDTARLYDLALCDMLYLHRVPLTSRTWPLCAAARLLRIPLIFDSDDLVWDEQERSYSYLDDHYSAAEVAGILKTIRRVGALMRRADAFVFSTHYLAQLAGQSFGQPCYVNQNALPEAIQAAAKGAYRQPTHGGPVVLGYFSGTPRVHDEDLATVAPALRTLLERYPQLRLRFYGGVAVPEQLRDSAAASRIEQHQFVQWQSLPQAISETDINIAPLVDNPQRRAKSGVKYLESALVAVPLVATRLEPYQHVISDGATGLLASSSDEWAAALSSLVESPELRGRIGQAARAHVLAEHTTASRSANFAAIVRRVIEH